MPKNLSSLENPLNQTCGFIWLDVRGCRYVKIYVLTNEK